MQEFAKQSDKAYWAWSYKHLYLVDRQLELPRECFNAGFYLGAQYAMQTSAELSPHVARFMEFIMWLTQREEPSNQLELPLDQLISENDQFSGKRERL